MSEMLANQYFLARKYEEAEKELEEVLVRDPENKSALKKIIVCYTHNQKINIALRILFGVISEDINQIIDTDPMQDDCPCFELIDEIEAKELYTNDTPTYYTMLGIFWMYCNLEKSYQNFVKASKSELEQSRDLVISIIEILKFHINKKEISTIGEKS